MQRERQHRQLQPHASTTTVLASGDTAHHASAHGPAPAPRPGPRPGPRAHGPGLVRALGHRREVPCPCTALATWTCHNTAVAARLRMGVCLGPGCVLWTNDDAS
jgi:hypothetical protein